MSTISIVLLFVAAGEVQGGDISEAKELQAKGRYSEAISVYRQILDTTSNNVEVSSNLAFCYERLGDFSSAAEAYAGAINERSSAELLTSRGICYVAVEQWEKAQTDFEYAISMEKDLALASLGLGVALIKSGDQEKGQKQIETAVASDPVCFERFGGRLLAGGSFKTPSGITSCKRDGEILRRGGRIFRVG